MNYLAHLYLADHTGTSLAGSVLGDSVKGRLCGAYPPSIELGIRLHRHIDSFTDTHPVVLNACARFEGPLRRYAGILLDIYFDHLLAKQWIRLHAEPLQQFAKRVSTVIWQQWPHPPLMQQRLASFPEVLLSYGQSHGIATALQRVSQRAKRANPMVSALPLLESKHELLAQDFDAFFPELIEFAEAEVSRLYSITN